MGTVYYELDGKRKLTWKEKKEIKEAAKRPIVFDEDCPELTDEQLEEFQRVAQERRKARQKQVLTLRVSASTMKKAKALGKGYTGILSRLLEMALDDPEMIKKCL
ncbi:MAG: BrnA antitoxin family protein [Lachnospiraceae bacterium]|nr:BrnA antitoxin family protein [Lachnospiraceae bacterium]